MPSLLSRPYLTLQRCHILPRIVVRVVALHAVQLVAIVATPDGVDVAVHDTHTVVGVLLLQRLDSAPAVVPRIVSTATKRGRK